MKNINKLKDFFKSNLGGRIHKNNFNVVTFIPSKRTYCAQFMCWQESLDIPDDFINEVLSLYTSIGLKCVDRKSEVYGTTVYFDLCLETDLDNSFRQILIWAIKDDLYE